MKSKFENTKDCEFAHAGINPFPSIFHNPPKGDRREVVPSVGNLRFGGGFARARLVFGVSALCGGFGVL